MSLHISRCGGRTSVSGWENCTLSALGDSLQPSYAVSVAYLVPVQLVWLMPCFISPVSVTDRKVIDIQLHSRFAILAASLQI